MGEGGGEGGVYIFGKCALASNKLTGKQLVHSMHIFGKFMLPSLDLETTDRKTVTLPKKQNKKPLNFSFKHCRSLVMIVCKCQSIQLRKY